MYGSEMYGLIEIETPHGEALFTEMCMWLDEQGFSKDYVFGTYYSNERYPGTRYVTWRFECSNEAMLFKLRWGGGKRC